MLARMTYADVVLTHALATPVRMLRKGLAASAAVTNAWQSVVEAGRGRAERDRLAPSVVHDGPSSWLEAIEPDECWRLLAEGRLGRIGFTAHSGRPVILPVNYTLDDRTILIRSGGGPKLEAARRGDLVAFEVDEIDAEAHTGWSVSVTGRARWVSDPHELARLETSEWETWAAGPRDHVIAVEPLHVGGRWLREPAR